MRLLLLLAISLSFALPATAAQRARDARATTKKERPSEKSVSVAIPRTELEAAPSAPAAPVAPLFLEVSASSWAPASFSRPSHLASATGFARGTLPYVQAALSRPLVTGSAGSIAGRLGVGFASLERTAVVPYGSASKEDRQRLYLVPAELGAELEPSILSGRALSASFSISALGVYGALEEASLSRSWSGAGLGAAFGASAYWRLAWLRGLLDGRSGLTAPQLAVGVRRTLGSLEGSSLGGSGLQAGLRVEL